MPYRSGFGIGTFGTGVFGVTGAIDGSATVTVASSVSASAQVVKQSAVTIAASASVTSSADVLSDALINIFLTSSVSANAEKYAQSDGYRTGYGLRTYGTSIYGQNESIESGLASISVASSVSASANVTAVGSATISSSASLTVGGEFSVVADVNITMTSTLAVNAVVTKNALATINLTSAVSASGRFKWEDASDPTDTWTDATDDGIVTWTDSPVREAA